MAGAGRPADGRAARRGTVAQDAILVTDGAPFFPPAARELGLAHVPLNRKAGATVLAPYRIQTVNSRRSCFRGFLERFRDVATSYPPNYPRVVRPREARSEHDRRCLPRGGGQRRINTKKDLGPMCKLHCFLGIDSPALAFKTYECYKIIKRSLLNRSAKTQRSESRKAYSNFTYSFHGSEGPFSLTNLTKRYFRPALKIFSFAIILLPWNTQANSAQCEPLLIMHGGALDSKSRLLKPLQNYWSRNGVQVKYYTKDDLRPAYRTVRNHLKQYPESSVVIIGHSWGADTALGVAETHGIEFARGSRKIKLLITLDGVGGNRVFPSINTTSRKEHPTKPDGVNQWINVWRDGPSGLLCAGGVATSGGIGQFVVLWQMLRGKDPIGNCAASLGGSWGYQKYVQNRETKKDHSNAVGMINELEGIVQDALKCS